MKVELILLGGLPIKIIKGKNDWREIPKFCLTVAAKKISLVLLQLFKFSPYGSLELEQPNSCRGQPLSSFCQFWQQHHVLQIDQCVRSLGTIFGSPVKLLCPNLGDAVIEVGTKWVFKDLHPPCSKSQATKKTEHEQDFCDE